MSHDSKQELDRRLRHVADMFPNMTHKHGQNVEQWRAVDAVVLGPDQKPKPIYPDETAELLRRVEIVRRSGISTFLQTENARIIFELAKELVQKPKAVTP